MARDSLCLEIVLLGVENPAVQSQIDFGSKEFLNISTLIKHLVSSDASKQAFKVIETLNCLSIAKSSIM